jgi:hypothetical protein
VLQLLVQQGTTYQCLVLPSMLCAITCHLAGWRVWRKAPIVHQQQQQLLYQATLNQVTLHADLLAQMLAASVAGLQGSGL